MGKRFFGVDLAERGFSPDKGSGNVSVRRGIGLKADTLFPTKNDVF